MIIYNWLILRGQSWYSSTLIGQELRFVSRSTYPEDKLNLQGFRIVKLKKNK